MGRVAGRVFPLGSSCRALDATRHKSLFLLCSVCVGFAFDCGRPTDFAPHFSTGSGASIAGMLALPMWELIAATRVLLYQF